MPRRIRDSYRPLLWRRHAASAIVILLASVCVLLPGATKAADLYPHFAASQRTLAFLAPNRPHSITTKDRKLLDIVWSSGGDTSENVGVRNPVEVGIICEGGSDPNRPQKVNQDAYFFQMLSWLKPTNTNTKYDQDERKDCNEELEEQQYTCLGVLDGHGLKGHLVSNYLADKLPGMVQYHMENLLDSPSKVINDTILNDLNEFEETLQRLGGLISPEDADETTTSHQHQPDSPMIHQAMTRAFHNAHYAAMQDPDIPAGRNGATCVMVVFEHAEKTLHVAHVGDSRVIQVDIQNGEDGIANFQVSPLSIETTVKIDTEKQRIKSGDGTLRGNNVFRGPQGIAMTRSLGNAVMLRAGIVPTPITDTFSYSKNNQETTSFLVIATDGIWDVLSNHMVAEILATSDTIGELQTACEAITSEARKRWIGDLPIMDEEKVDDITCMVVKVS